ncbi:hypothetical protein JZO72_05855 [Vagococcus fluvialis]|uniref:hypothetical protein n=1 Tax=Vagococcus fluvialis TaxID=2738 RepID=UPI001A8FCB3B|nr:hypothetical protein [Vagococcus fluvialis]MBO0479149.1 hypothetical protein [Vagococcus fluvialis]MBO0484705.1 hypothetical protein [Vagococcus fluvialis]
MNKDMEKMMEKVIKNLGNGEEIERRTPQVLENLLIIWKETANEQRFQQFMFNLNENFTKELLKVDYRFVDKESNQQYAKDLFYVKDELFEMYLDQIIEKM